MVSNAILIRDALQMLGILREGKAASAEQGELGLRVLNELMADWESDGVNLEYYPQTELSDDCPIPDTAIAGVKGFLAANLAVYYGKAVTQEFVGINQRFYARLVRDSVRDQAIESSLTDWPGSDSNYDITSG